MDKAKIRARFDALFKAGKIDACLALAPLILQTETARAECVDSYNVNRLQTCPACERRFRVQARNDADSSLIEAGAAAGAKITPDAARLRRLKRLCALRGNARQKEAAAALQAGEAMPRNVFYFWPPVQICPDCETAFCVQYGRIRAA